MTSSASTGYDRLHPHVQRWVWEQGWRSLRGAQEAVIPLVLDGRGDVILAAATAAGKTEAAFLPICSALLAGPPVTGFGAVYVSPLKALINDQFTRLGDMCKAFDIPVHRWHGDVAASRKRDALDRPAGLLLITPESLEALFVTHGPRTRTLFSACRFVVIDELHSFIGSPRGAQLRSLLHRMEYAGRRRIRRVGLSATLGDMAAAAEFMRPGGSAQVALVSTNDDPKELRLQVRGYRTMARRDDTSGQLPTGADPHAIAGDLFTLLRGSDNLVFVDGRAGVETYADLLARRSASERVPNEFLPHHGSLSKELREDAEARLKDPATPTTAICTSTLEMGIDIGSVTSVAQVGAPSSVAAVRQRLGRSGRRGEPAVLRIFASEPDTDDTSLPQDRLRATLVQSVATVELLLQGWYEPPDTGGLQLSTLVHQVLALVAEHNGVTPADAYRVLVAEGPFPGVTSHVFGELLRDLHMHDLIRQEPDGLLLHGRRGEQEVNHYGFFAAFSSTEEYQLVTDGRRLGTLPITHPLVRGGLVVFAGQRWKVVSVDDHARRVELVSTAGGHAPRFTGSAAPVHDRVRTEMRRVYESEDVPGYLDTTATKLLSEGRHAYRALGLRTAPLVEVGSSTVLIPLRGDSVMATIAVALRTRGISVATDGIALTLADTSVERASDVLTQLAAAPAPRPEDLAEHVTNKVVEKYDGFMGDEVLDVAYASRQLDVGTAWQTLNELASAVADRRSRSRHRSAPPRRTQPPRPRQIGDLPYAVVDVETTGLDPLRHRVVEVAVVRLDATAAEVDQWSTLVDPGQELGSSTLVHGLTTADLVGAPTFAQVAGELAERLDGSIVVAHNIAFDAAFLTNEFARIGSRPDDLLTLCTLILAGRFGTATTSYRLADCVAAEGLACPVAHVALEDARAAASLLTTYLERAERRGLRLLDDLGANGRLPADDWAPGKLGGFVQKHRTARRAVRLDPRPVLPVPAFPSAASMLYADVVARHATAGMVTSKDVSDLAGLATSLGVEPDARRAVHQRLEEVWHSWPSARRVLTRLDREPPAHGVRV